MADVQLPETDPHAGEPPARSTGHRWVGKPLVLIAVEVVLITMGVFLALLGEQWRERSEHREQAESALRRFRTEIGNNRRAVAASQGYHATLKQGLDDYFALEGPKTPERFDVKVTRGLAPIFFEHTAWDLALATGSLAYIEQDLAFALSRAYTIQNDYLVIERAILATVYGRSWSQDFEGYWRSMRSYLGDVSYFDPAVLKAYDEVSPRIDRALGESVGASPAD